jgi:eukaryotic-like serine/threonine-protein kinase
LAEGASARVGGNDAEETLPLGLPRPGDVVAGRYEVERELGGGAMGIVLQARDRQTGVDVAIKFLKGARARHSESATRFVQEARATRALRSAYVVRVLDVGVLDSGTPYFVMELLEGENMLDRLRVHRPLPVEEVVDAVVEACAAMDEAHARGIVHRDLKPANLFRTIDSEGRPRVKVLDFGISKILEDAEDPELTNTTDMLGSPHYMSPEQLRSAKHVDHRSDIWSLGVALHRLLTGQPPFAGQNMTAVCAAVMADDPSPPSKLRPDVPPAIDAIVARCLRKQPGDRFDSAAALGRALAPFGSERSRLAAATYAYAATSGLAVQADDTAARHGRSRGLVLAGVGAALVLAIVAGAALSRRGAGQAPVTRTDHEEPLAAPSASTTAPSLETSTATAQATAASTLETVPPIVAASTPPKLKTKPLKTPQKPQLATKGTTTAKTAAPATTSTSPWGSVIDDRK